MRQRIESLEQFRALQADYMAARDAEKRKILVCCGTGCVAGGNLNVYHELKKRMDELGIPCEVSLTEHHADTIGLKKSGCHGFCEMGPLVRIEPEGWLYTKCQVSDVEELRAVFEYFFCLPLGQFALSAPHFSEHIISPCGLVEKFAKSIL